MRVLAIGECIAELAPSDTLGDYRLGSAGDTFNTAWYLAQLVPDITVSYPTVVGDDAISQNMTASMRKSGIDNTLAQTVPDQTVGLHLISFDKGERSFSYWRGQSAALTLANDPTLLGDAVAAADVIYFSGITLAGLDPDKRYATAGATTIIVKNGEAPVLYREGKATGEMTVTPVAQVVDTTAAGDSFNAGIFVGHTPGLSLRASVWLACSVSREVDQIRGALLKIDLPPFSGNKD